MFRWNEIQVIDYGFTEPYELPLRGASTVITGENGSGKSTFLDGLRLLVGDRELTDDRSLNRYLRRNVGAGLLVAYVSNEAVKGRRFFRAYNADEVTLACAILRGNNKATPTKRYFIGPGRVAVKELREAGVTGSKWMGPEEFRRQLEIYGLSDSILNLLAIRQGEVQRVCSSKPRQLYEYVLNSLANPEIIKKYSLSLEELARIDQDLIATNKALEVEDLKLKNRQHELEKLDQYESLRRTQEENGQLAIAARLQAKLRASDKHDSDFQDRTADAQGAANEIVEIKKAIAQLQKSVQPLRRDLDSRGEKLAEAVEAERRTTEHRDALEPRYSEYQASRQALKEIPRIPLEQADKKYRLAAKALEPVVVEVDRATTTITNLEEEVGLLEAGKTAYPGAVRTFYQALRSAKIRFQTIAELFADVEPDQADALENSLGPLRYSILVKPADSAKARATAKNHNFVASIFDAQTTKTTIEGVEFSDEIPPWLAEKIRRTKLGRDGTWSDDAGDWVHVAESRVLPSKRKEERLRTFKIDLETLKRGLQKILATKTGFEQDLHDATDQLQKAGDRARHDARVKALEPEAEAYKDALRQARQAEREADAVRNRHETLEERVKLLEDAVADRIREMERQDALRIKMEGRAQKAEQEMRLVENAAADLRKGLALELQVQAEKYELSESDHYAERAREAKQALERFRPAPDPNIRTIVETLRKNVEALHASVTSRESDQRNHLEAMTASRRQYIQAANLQLQEYKKRLETFEKYTGSKIRAEVPRFTEATTDREIQEAELKVFVGFDNKTPELVGIKGAFSGGQRVVVGLMLIMALADVTRQGFFIIDEPYESLSVTRVDQIARFIHETPFQMIITVPTSFDPGHYQAGSVLVRFKEAPNENTPAPRPVFMVKRLAA